MEPIQIRTQNEPQCPKCFLVVCLNPSKSRWRLPNSRICQTLGALAFSKRQNFRKPRDRPRVRGLHSEECPMFPSNAKQYLAIACTAFQPQPEGPHTSSWRPELTLLYQRSRVADTHMAHSTRFFQTNLCRLGWATLLARGKIIQTLFCFLPVTELIDLLRNLITVSFHGEIQLQPLPP